MEIIATDTLYHAALPGGSTVTCMSYAMDGALLLVGTDKGILMAFAETDTSSTLSATVASSAKPKRAKHSSSISSSPSASPPNSPSPPSRCGECIFADTLHCGAVMDVQLSSAGDRVITAGHDATCVLFSLADVCAFTPAPERRRQHGRSDHATENNKEDFRPGCLLRRNGVQRVKTGHSLPMVSAVFFTYATRIATLAVDGRLEIIDVSSAEPGVRRVVAVCESGFAARTLCLSVDERYCFIGGSCLLRVDVLRGGEQCVDVTNMTHSNRDAAATAAAAVGNDVRYAESERCIREGVYVDRQGGTRDGRPSRQTGKEAELHAVNDLYSQSMGQRRDKAGWTFYEWVEEVEDDLVDGVEKGEGGCRRRRRRVCTDANVFIDRLQVDRRANTLTAFFAQHRLTEERTAPRRCAYAVWNHDSAEYWCSRVYQVIRESTQQKNQQQDHQHDQPQKQLVCVSSAMTESKTACESGVGKRRSELQRAVPAGEGGMLDAIAWPKQSKSLTRETAVMNASFAARYAARSMWERLPRRVAQQPWPTGLGAHSLCARPALHITGVGTETEEEEHEEKDAPWREYTMAEKMAIVSEENRRLERECSALVGRVKQLLSAKTS